MYLAELGHPKVLWCLMVVNECVLQRIIKKIENVSARSIESKHS